MAMTQFTTLDLEAIDPTDLSFRISRADTDTSALALSIARTGLVLPLAVMEKDPCPGKAQRVVLVSGFRRFAALKSLGATQAACRILPESQALGCACLAVAENAFGRELESGELVRAVGLLAQYMDTAKMAGESQALFNKTLNQGYLDTLLAVFRLPDPALALLDQGLLSIKAAKVLAGMDPTRARTLLEVFSRIRASLAKQMEILTWTREIEAREGSSLQDLFKTDAFQAILWSEPAGQDLGALGDRFRAALFSRRFPQLDRAKKRAAALVKDLKLPKGVRLGLPENFEGMVYSLTLEFETLPELIDRLSGLSTPEAQEIFKSLLDR